MIMRVRTLGEARIEIGHTRIGPSSSVMFALLLLLSSQEGRPVSRTRLRELLWPDTSDEKAQHSLRQLIFRVRRLGVRLDTSAGHVRLDKSLVEADFTSIRRSLSDSRSDRAVDGLGPYLAGYNPRFSQAFADWLEEQRAVVHAEVRRVLVTAIATQRARGNWSVVEHLARRLLVIDPLNEEATLSLAEATALSGSKVQAVTLLDRYVADVQELTERTLHLPTSVLRKRIAELIPDPPCAGQSEIAFVGRGDSFAFLNRCIKARGRSGVVGCFVWGPAGIGKTRLLNEFRRVVALEGIRVERFTCHQHDRRRPMSVFAGLVPRLLALPGALGCDPATLDFLNRLVRHDSDVVAPIRSGSDPDLLASSVSKAVLDLLDAVSSEIPLILIVEDVHWADAQSETLLGEVVSRLASRALSVICSSRVPAGGAYSGFVAHELRPLEASEMRRLVELLAHTESSSETSPVDRCVQIAEGNPLYATSLIEFWRASGNTNAIPPSIFSLLSDRLAALDADSLLTLQAVAVLGRNATPTSLGDMLQLPNYRLVRSLAHLEAGRFIIGDGNRLSCAHELIASAATTRLSELARRHLHRLSAEAITSDHPTAPDAGILWDCANHWKQAGEPERAFRFAIDCGRYLLEIGLAREACELLLSVRRDSERATTTTAFLDTLALACHRAARWPDLVAVMNEKLTRSGSTAFESIEDELMYLEGCLRSEAGDLAHIADRALHCTRGASASAQRIRAATLCLVVYSECCQQIEAVSVYEAIADAAAAPGADPLLVAEVEVLYHTSFGDINTGAESARRLVSAARQHSSPRILAKSLRFAANAFRMAGHLDEAESSLLEALAVARRHHLTTAISQATNKLAVFNVATNRFDVALRWAEKAAALVDGTVPRIHALERTVTLVQAHLGLGDIERASHVYDSQNDYSVPPELLRAVTELTSLRIRMTLARSPELVTPTEVERFYILYLRMRDKGAQDFAVDTLLRSLDSLGEVDRANVVCNEYVKYYRRDRGPLSVDLEARVSSKGREPRRLLRAASH